MAGSTSTKDQAKSSANAAASQQKDIDANRAGADEFRSELDRQRGREEAAVVGVTDTVASDLYDDDASEQFVTLKKDVIEEFRYPDSTRPAYRVLYTKGQRVQKSAIDAYNAATEAKPVDELEGAEKVAAYVDSTTLASGTTPGIGALEAQAGGKKSGDDGDSGSK